MRSVAHWLLVIMACLAVAAGLGFFKYRQIQGAIAQGKSFGEPVTAVELFIAREETWQPTTIVTGELVARRAVDLSNELAGRIVEVGFEPGAVVAAGEVLLRLDTREERAMLAAARADAEIARLDLERNARLVRSGAAAREVRDKARAQFDAASAEVERLQVIIDKKTIRAPFDALAGLHELQAGQYLGAATVFTHLIGIGDDIWIEFTLPQVRAQVSVGAPVEVHVDGPLSRLTLTARVIARDPFVDERSRSVRFRALADNADGKLAPGMLVRVAVPMGAPQRVTVVPPAAVRYDTFGPKVFVLRPAEDGARAPERAEQRRVTVGAQRGDRVVITAGVEPGERVAGNGAFKLRDGALVRASEPEPRSDPSRLAAK